LKPVSENKWNTNKRIKIKYVLEIPTFYTYISQVLTIPTYLWLHTNFYKIFIRWPAYTFDCDVIPEFSCSLKPDYFSKLVDS